MSENKKIKFAVIGCGHIGKRHAEMVIGNTEGELVALCDVKPKEDLGIEKYNVPFFTSIEELLAEDLDIDVINICTPNGLHSDQSNANHRINFKQYQMASRYTSMVGEDFSCFWRHLFHQFKWFTILARLFCHYGTLNKMVVCSCVAVVFRCSVRVVVRDCTLLLYKDQ